MFKVSDSNVKITKTKVISDKMTVGTLYSTYKNDKNQFIKTFIECKIVGNALRTFNYLGIQDKQKFTIVDGIIKNEPYIKDGAEKSKLVVTVFELKPYEEQ